MNLSFVPTIQGHFFTAFKKVTFVKVARNLLIIFLVVFPFQIRTLVFNGSYLLTGNFNEYSSFFIYLSDLLLVGSFLAYGIAYIRNEVEQRISFGENKLAIILLFFLLLLMGSVFFAELRPLSLLSVFRFIELFLLFFLIVNKVLSRDEVLTYFIYGVLIQVFIAIEQYFLQASVGVRWLGEPLLSADMPGVAKVDMGGEKILRSYGTMLHPNVLAGILMISLFWAYYVFRKNMWLLITVVGLILLAMIFTFSRSAFIAFAGALLVYFSVSNNRIPIKKIILWISIFLLIVVVFNLENIIAERFLSGDDPFSGAERFQYLNISKNMLVENPFGVGMGHFTLYMQDFVTTKLSPWTMQPVHNVYLLIMNEAGIFAGGVFIMLLGYLFYALLKAHLRLKGDDEFFVLVQTAILAGLVILFLFDHYFYSIYQGQVLFFIYLALSSSLVSKERLPLKKS